MPLFMDQHDTAEASAEDLARAHIADLAVQDRYGVTFLTYWLDYAQSTANCLVEAPDPEAVTRAHAAAHGNLPNRIIPVVEGEVATFMGRTADPGPGPITEPGTRVIVFTDLVGSTTVLDRLGDDAAMALLRTHNRLVRETLAAHRGREVKHTGDGFMLVFDSASEAVRFSVELQRRLAAHSAAHPDQELDVRIGINAGEPVTEEGDLFGAAVNIARRLCDRAGSGKILASAVIAGLTAGKGFTFTDVAPLQLKGFAAPWPACEVVIDRSGPK